MTEDNIKDLRIGMILINNLIMHWNAEDNKQIFMDAGHRWRVSEDGALRLFCLSENPIMYDYPDGNKMRFEQKPFTGGLFLATFAKYFIIEPIEEIIYTTNRIKLLPE
ncbi:MAG TPA: hypothetical protein VKR58_02650 [Aquella sp.]|nr:hypothetical protein [Aquella sp.]